MYFNNIISIINNASINIISKIEEIHGLFGLWKPQCKFLVLTKKNDNI